MAKPADVHDDSWAKLYSSAVAALNAAGDDVIASSLWCMRRDGVVGVDGCCGMVYEVPHGYYIYVPPNAESPLLSFTERVTIRALNGPVMVTEHAASRLDWPMLCPLQAGQCERRSMEYFFFDEPICALICDLMKYLCRLSYVTHASLCDLYAMAKRVKKTLKKHAPAASAADKPASRKRQRTE